MRWCRRQGYRARLPCCCEREQHGAGWGWGCHGSPESCFPDWRTGLKDPAMGLPYFGVKQSSLLAGTSAEDSSKGRVGAGMLVGMAGSKLTVFIFVLNV